VNRLMGDGYNAIVPAGGFGGEPLKLNHLAHFVPAHTVTVALIGDRLANAASGFLVSAVCLVVALNTYAWPGPVTTLAWLWSASALVATVAISVLATSRLPARLSGKALRFLGREGVDAAPIERAPYYKALAWNVLGRVLGLLEIAVLLTLLDLPATVPAIAAIGGLLLASGVLGLVIPQGFGVFEAMSVYAFQLVGFATPAGLCFGLARRGRMLLFSLLGVLLHVSGAATPTPSPASSSSAR